MNCLKCKNIFFMWIVVSLGVVQPARAEAVDYSLYAKVLKAYVNGHGRVDYEALKKDQQDLDVFIGLIEKADVAGLSGNGLKAFWINAYNAITLKVVADHYPVSGIRRINFGLVWEIPRKVAGRKYSLGHIEHSIVRPMGDPRVHFALNCASIGCPELPQEPFYPEKLEQQLEHETAKFFRNPAKLFLDRSTNTLYHSAILEWFEEDFLLVSDSLLSYIKKYLSDGDRKYVESADVQLKAFDYDWALNKQ